MLDKKLKYFQVVLGSGSPRRKELLKSLGIDFVISTRNTKENFPENLPPKEIAVYLSQLKAEAFEKDFFYPNKLLITADTIVVLENKILGKPQNRNNAINMLLQLSGKVHNVITGITLKTSEKKHSFYSLTKVHFKTLSSDEINYYVDTFKPFDKAGAYGIQEWIGHAAVEKIEGSYFNVVGLPTHKLYEELLLFI